MKKSIIKIYEGFNLLDEINGVKIEDKIILKGLLNEKLQIKTKYWLGKLVKKLAENKESVEKLRIELVEKFGVKAEDGSFSIPYKIEDVINPKILEFQKEYNELLQENFEFEHTEFFLQDFANLETESNYNEFFKLIEE